MKSLRNTGIDTAAPTASRSSSEPLNRRCSVSTLMMRAPQSSYARASFAGSEIDASAPRDGLARFTSAITPMPGSRSAASTSSGGGALLAISLISARETTASRAATSARTPSMMESSTVAELIPVVVPPVRAFDLHRRVTVTTPRSITDPCCPNRSGPAPRRGRPRSPARMSWRPPVATARHDAHSGPPRAWLWSPSAPAAPHRQRRHRGGQQQHRQRHHRRRPRRPAQCRGLGLPEPVERLHLDPHHSRRRPQCTRGQQEQELAQPYHGSVSVSAAASAFGTALALFAASVYSYGPLESATTPPPACT